MRLSASAISDVTTVVEAKATSFVAGSSAAAEVTATDKVAKRCNSMFLWRWQPKFRLGPHRWIFLSWTRLEAPYKFGFGPGTEESNTDTPRLAPLHHIHWPSCRRAHDKTKSLLGED